jgi:dolichol kinase
MLTNKEFQRQLVHILVGLITILLIHLKMLSSLAIFLLIILGISISLISKRVKIPIINKFLNHLEREEIKNKFPGKGVIFFFTGVLLVLQLFQRDIALAAIMILTLGDSVSHIVGGKYGQLKNLFNDKSKKLFEGTIAGTLAGFLGALIFVPATEAFLASFIAMVAEVIKIDFNDHTLDDNLVVPLIAGTTIFLLRTYL